MALSVIPIIGAMLVGGLTVLCFILIGIYASRYRKVKPGTALIIYGKMTRPGKDMIIVTKGGMFIWPVFQAVTTMPIDLRSAEYRIGNIYPPANRNGQVLDSLINTSYQIGPDERSIRKAAISLPNRTAEDIEKVVMTALEKAIRHEARKMNFDTLLNDPISLEIQTRSSLSRDLSELGINLRSISVAVIPRS